MVCSVLVPHFGQVKIDSSTALVIAFPFFYINHGNDPQGQFLPSAAQRIAPLLMRWWTCPNQVAIRHLVYDTLTEMRNIVLLFLMMVLPLQGLWAAAQTYHVLGEGQDVVTYSVMHNHDHDHDHDLSHDHGHFHAHSHGDQGDSSDHHHHCTGHGAMVLSTWVSNIQPDLRYSEYSPVPALTTSNFHTRIERPNWC